MRIPGAQGAATLERLRGKGLTATTGVTLGGQGFGTDTTTGTLAGRSAATAVRPANGTYVVRMPKASAAMLTLAGYVGLSSSRSASTPSHTSTNRVVSGEKPEPDHVGAAEVGDHAPLDQTRAQRRARPGARARRGRRGATASRGEATRTPSSPGTASASAIANSVSAIPFARIASIPASATIRTPSSTAASASTGGVPDRNARIPGAAS